MPLGCVPGLHPTLEPFFLPFSQLHRFEHTQQTHTDSIQSLESVLEIFIACQLVDDAPRQWLHVQSMPNEELLALVGHGTVLQLMAAQGLQGPCQHLLQVRLSFECCQSVGHSLHCGQAFTGWLRTYHVVAFLRCIYLHLWQ